MPARTHHAALNDLVHTPQRYGKIHISGVEVIRAIASFRVAVRIPHYGGVSCALQRRLSVHDSEGPYLHCRQHKLFRYASRFLSQPQVGVQPVHVTAIERSHSGAR